MIPGIGTIVNGVGVLVVGILSRVIFKKELKDFEDNLLPLGLLVLALGLRESLKSPDYVRLINFEISGCLLYTSPSPRDRTRSRMPSSA